MWKKNIKILNFVQFVSFTIYLILGNPSVYPRIRGAMNGLSNLEFLSILIIGGLLGLFGIYIIYNSLAKMKKVIYQIFFSG